MIRLDRKATDAALHRGEAVQHLHLRPFGVGTQIVSDAAAPWCSAASLSVSVSTRPRQVKPVPGRPAEAFIRTGEAKVISYLMKSPSDQCARAFGERQRRAGMWAAERQSSRP